ncbi:MAG: GPP34 family phosphoprotein [Candidatus Lokiarchaeia archaeon]
MLLGEKFLLLPLKERSGKLPLGGKGMSLKNVLPGTVLKDLRMRGKIDLQDTGGKKGSIHVVVKDKTPTGHPLLDDYLKTIANYQGKKGQSTQGVTDWVKFYRDKRKRMTEKHMWQDLEQEGVIKNQGNKHILLKPQIKKELEEDIRLVAMNQKEPDEDLKALVGFIKRHHGWRHYVSRSERDREYCKRITQDQIISEIVFWELVVEKRKALGAGAQAVGAAAQTASRQVTAASQYGVDTLAHGMSHQDASMKMNTSIQASQTKLSRSLSGIQTKKKKIRLKKEKEE